MSVVVDASVAIKWFISEDLHDLARALLYDRGGDLQAPDLIMAEVANVAWKKTLRGEITHQQARAIPLETNACLSAQHSSASLVGPAMEIGLTLKHPIYDCIYVACAVERSCSLVTADARLVSAAAATGLATTVRPLSDWASPGA